MTLRRPLFSSIWTSPKAFCLRNRLVPQRLITTSQPSEFEQTRSEIPPSSSVLPSDGKQPSQLNPPLHPNSQIHKIQRELKKGTPRSRLSPQPPSIMSTSQDVQQRRSDINLKRFSLPYHVSRSATNNLPVYSEVRNTLYLTVIRRISGDLNKLRDDVAAHLNLDEEWCYVKQQSGQVVVKGRRKAALEEFLQGKGF